MHTVTPSKREYCLRMNDDEQSVMINDRDPNYSFIELHVMNVTAMQIFLWSASMDVAEQYQYSLDHLNEFIDADQIFFNCTSPWFGSRCQYSFESNETQGSIDLSCYILLECDRGTESSLCLDWREICDGRIDCLNDGVDEAQCFRLEMNECEEKEYRCHNGLCIPESFWKLDQSTVECLDQSDVSDQPRCPNSSPTSNLFICEEYACRFGRQRFSCGDGQCVEDFHPCDNGRHLLLFQSISLQGNLSTPCWLAMLCLTRLTGQLNETSCEQFFRSSSIIDYLQTCESLLPFPVTPVLNGHIRFLYRPHQFLPPFIHSTFLPAYICYDEHLCEFLRPTLRNGSYTCQESDQFGLSSTREYPSWTSIIDTVKPFFDACHVRLDDEGPVEHASLYQCEHSSKQISKYRIADDVADCYLADDEQDFELSCSLNDPHRFQCPGERRCRAPSLQLFPCPSLPETRLNVERIAFNQLCDGHIDILPHLIDGRNHSDETSCEAWPCVNIYTRCDGFWNCPNGTDEENCRPSNCVGDSLACISPINHTMFCLPARQVQDGIIDCLAALDELQVCRKSDIYDGVSYQLRCLNGKKCVEPSIVCSADQNDTDRSDERFCEEWASSNRSELQRMLCPLSHLRHHSFTLSESQTYPSSAMTQLVHSNELNIQLSNDRDEKKFQRREMFSRSLCVHGYPISHWWGENRYTAVCFCPPNYYGAMCEFQNQRVSLTLMLSAMKTSTVYDLFVKLISADDDREEIHSFEQFIFVSTIDCRQTFEIYLLYSIRPKNLSINYTVHIDVYDKTHLRYLASWYATIPFLFLPVNRIALLITLTTNPIFPQPSCSIPCQHGVCVKYTNKEKFFCRCQSVSTRPLVPLVFFSLMKSITGWSGARCHIPIDCNNCSSDSLCLGHVQQQAICLCPVNKFGSRCLLKHSCPPHFCHHNGLCIVTNARLIDDSYLCICSEQFYGPRCENVKQRLEISLEKIHVSSYLVGYIYSEVKYGPPVDPEVIFRKLKTMSSTMTFYLQYLYQMVVIRIDGSYYLAVLQQQPISNISTGIDSTRRCVHIDELLSAEQLKLPRIERVKFYHRLCQIDRHRQCFLDESYLCLCTMEQFANCFLFTRRDDYQCYENEHCLNDGQCLQDFSTCPLTTICLCVDCFFGDYCQFYAKGIGLTLDDILRYEIRLRLPLSEQSPVIKVTISFTATLFVIGWINCLLSWLTFRRPRSRQVGCGLYLFVLSIDYAVIVTVLSLQCCFVLFSQIIPSINVTIVRLGCLLLDPLLKLSLWLSNWLNVCISMERAMTASRGVYFNVARSRHVARQLIVCLPVVVIVSSFYQYLSRDLFYDEEEQRAWCVTLYSPSRHAYATSISFFHLFAPFVINLVSALFLIYTVTRQRGIARPLNSYAHHLREQLTRHKRLIISPVVLIVLAVPLLIFSLYFRCVKSTSNPWLYVCSYFVAFIPCTLTFVIYVLPSHLYRKEFRAAVKDFRKLVLRVWV